MAFHLWKYLRLADAPDGLPLTSFNRAKNPMNLIRLSPLSAPVSGVLRFLCMLCFALPLLAALARAASEPCVASIARMQPGPVTTADTLKWRVTFTQAVTGVDPADFALTQVDGSATAVTLTVTAGANAAEYLVSATGVAGVGTLRLDVKSSGTGIVNGDSHALAGGFTFGQSYTHALGMVPVAWGDNEYGQLGLGTTDGNAHSFPALVLRAGALADKTVVAVSSGESHSLALCSDGTVAAWGWNSHGELGNGARSE